MRPSQKSGRSRGKGNRNNNSNKNMGHSPNRVYESAGPEGKVRGTPQQIIDKYLALARDAQLSGDRVTAENFLQHAEHYSRILVAAAEAAAERQSQHQANQQQPSQDRDDDNSNDNNARGSDDGDADNSDDNGGNRRADRQDANNNPQQGDRRRSGGEGRSTRGRPPRRAEGDDQQPPSDGLAAFETQSDGPADIVETPESAAKPAVPRPRRPRPKAPKPDEGGETAAAPVTDVSSEPAE